MDPMKPRFHVRADMAPVTPPAPTSLAIVPVLMADTTTTSAAWCPTGVAVGQWGNSVSGLGVPGYDPASSLMYSRGRIPDSMTVDQLYTFDWLADRIVELMPSIAMVRGFELSEDTDDGELTREWIALNYTERFPHGAFQRAVNDGRAYGGSVLLCGYALGAPTDPLTPEASQGGILFFDVVAQHELRVVSRFKDPKLPNFDMPEIYEIIAAGNGPPHPRRTQRFHSSRGIRFSGRILRLPYNNGEVGAGPEVGVSVLTPVLNVIGQYGLAWSAVSNMLQDASIGVLKMNGLVEALASEDKAIIEDRMRVMQMTKGVHRTIHLDGDANEEYTRVEVSLTDVPAVIQQFMVAVAGASGCPARIFFSSSPSGLNANASGDSDLNQFYAACADYQARYLGPKLDTVLTAINGGTAVHVTWPSLWDASENEKAQTRLANMNATKVAWDMGACEATDVVKAAQTGTLPELIGKPDDDRAALAPPAVGETDPAGAPGAQGAAKIATKQRAAAKK